MRQFVDILTIGTRGRGLVEVTPNVLSWVGSRKLETGLLTLFCRHTSASLIIQENASPDVRADLEAYLARIAPEEPGRYRHSVEGADDMPAHIRTVLTGVHLCVPLMGGRLALGAWQGIYLFEHRQAPHRREVAVHLIGE
jgi:secondary thiamine-phosphate synthase enzyme